MSHAAIHIVLGMLAASLLTLPALLRAWRRNLPLARPCAVWLLACYAAGGFALIPSVLARLGAPPALCQGWWMNIFLLHPLVRGLRPGGQAVGAALIGAAFALQYLLLLLLIGFRRRNPLPRP